VSLLLDPGFVAGCLAAGALAGLAAGLLGVGGGLVVVPALAFLLPRAGVAPEVALHLAVGTSLATIVVTGLASALAHHRRGAVRTDVLAALVPGMVAGALAAGPLAGRLPGDALRLAYAAFAGAVAVRMLLAVRPRPGAGRLPGRGTLAAAGGGIGLVSALVGVGGGTLTVPFLARCGLAMHGAVGTSAATGPPIALAGALGFVAAGWGDPALPALATGYVLWPAFAVLAAATLPAARLGARLAHRLPADTLRRVFGLLLLLVAARMLLA
jgi:hypothetical protein